MKHKLFRTILMIMLSCAGTVSAVTLGQARVMSYLGQPLDAEIDLVGLAPGQHQDLNLRIANDRHFERLGIFYTKFLDTLTFDVARSDGHWMVRARSKQPVMEPYLDFPLQLSWSGGKLVRQYTLLLDPPAREKPRLATRKGHAAPGATQTPATRSSNTYGPVRRGEILTAIAQKLKPQGITTWQMSVVLFRANPHAFTNGNINKLRVGSILTIPPLEVIEELDNPSAIAEFAAVTTQQEHVPTATSPRTAEISANHAPEASPETSITAKTPQEARETTAEAAAGEVVDEARLRVVTDKGKKDEIPNNEQEMHEQLMVAMEDVETHRMTNDTIDNRLVRMEAQLAHMQRLLELKDAQIVAIQSEVNAHREISKAAQKAEKPPSPIPMAETAAARRPDTETPQSVVKVQEAAPLPIQTAPTEVRPWYEEYLWAVWIVLGLMALPALFMLMRRPLSMDDPTDLLELPLNNHDEVPSVAQIDRAPSGSKITEAERPENAAAREEVEPKRRVLRTQPFHAPGVEIHTGPPELEGLDLPSYWTAAEGILDLNADEDAPLEAVPENEDSAVTKPGSITTAELGMDDDALPEALSDGLDNPDTEHESTVPSLSAISEGDLASWSAELVENTDQPDEHTAHDGGVDLPVELSAEPPVQLDDDIPDLPATPDEPSSAEMSAQEPIPDPIEIELDDDDGSWGENVGLIDGTGDEEDITLSLDLARAYIEIGDEDGAKEILERALLGVPDPAPRRQMEELLAQIG